MDLAGRLANVPMLNAAGNQVNQFGSSKVSMTSVLENAAPSLSPSPKFREPPPRTSRDDSMLDDSPSTPRRPSFHARGLSLQMPPKDIMNLGAMSRIPLSPKLDAAETYGSPVIPRRSRGLDFSRAATNLHHSTLADQSSPDSSPTLNGRGMNIPGRRRSGQFEAPSHRAQRPSGDRTTVSSSLGSVNMLSADSSDSDSDDENMLDDIDDSVFNTPQTGGSRMPIGLNIWTTGPQSTGANGSGLNWMKQQSKASNSLMNFRKSRTERARDSRPKKHSSSSSSMASPMSRSPPMPNKEAFNQRRESISWHANQLHIDGSESEDGLQLKNTLENADNVPTTPARDARGGVVKRAVTRRGNMLPKTKGFARIRAALAEESAPVETELRREATVIKQTRENDMELETTPRVRGKSIIASSPIAAPSAADPMEDPTPFNMNNTSQSESFKLRALKNPKGVGNYWDGCEQRNNSSLPPNFMARDSTSDEMSMDSPILGPRHASSTSQPSDTMSIVFQGLSASPTRATTPIPEPLNIRSVNNKRRRDDDFDPMSFKRRAVSPGMSVQNSPVMQSPMERQREIHPFNMRPPGGANEKGLSMFDGLPGLGIMNTNGNGTANGAGRGPNRIGLKGMTDTNDGLMKMSIE